MSEESLSPGNTSDTVPAGGPSRDEVIYRLNRLWIGDSAFRETGVFDVAGLLNTDSTVRLEPALEVSGYQIREVIGSGSFGVVYRAYDSQLNRDVAIKIPRPEVLADQAKLRRFEGEARAVAKLDHPAIVPIYEADLNPPTPYLALAYIPGPDLRQFLAERTAELPWRDAVELVTELAQAVHYAHECGIQHRDLKPSNVLLLPRNSANADSASLKDFQPRLTDFGLAKLSRESLEETGSSMVVGTPLYMSPEVFSKGASDGNPGAADIYSLGCLLYELLTGRPPITGDSYVQVIDRLREERPELIRRLRPELPASVETICRVCLEKNPAARYASAAELAEELQRAAQGEPLMARRSSWRKRLLYWMEQPQRVRAAGWYSLLFHLILLSWLCVMAATFHLFIPMTADEYRNQMLEGIRVLTTVDIPMVLIAVMTIKRKRWAVRSGVVMSFLFTSYMVAWRLGWVKFFENIYREENYHSHATFFLIFFAAVIELVLYNVALVSISRRPPDQDT
ncbi:MAG TPA: serine/threonine-protein kinase [Planctomicrobium sp.]|nr:serine/threonine-protein kinase [Planctomicrobium sp.]